MAVTKSDYLAYVRSLEGRSIDQDNVFYAQCVDLILHVYAEFWDGFMVWGNAIDFTYNAMPDGFKRGSVAEMGIESGDILVWYWGAGDEYGHIGICLSYENGQATSLEQNVDGTMLNGIYTGPARIRTRNIAQVVAVIRPQFLSEEAAKQKETKKKEKLMFTTSASGRGIALIQGGRFMPFQKPTDPVNFWSAGVPHINVAVETFDDWQRNSGAGAYDQEMVKAMRELLKETKK